MTLSNLIKKGGLAKAATATPATVATVTNCSASCVAIVAGVAVAAKPEPLHELSEEEESSIRAWLEYIEETDPVIIAEVMTKCQSGAEARGYCLEQSKQVPPEPEPDYTTTCGACRHFERTSHPRLGHCSKGEPEAIAGLWDTDHRYCEQYLSGPEQSDNGRSISIKANI